MEILLDIFRFLFFIDSIDLDQIIFNIFGIIPHNFSTFEEVLIRIVLSLVFWIFLIVVFRFFKWMFWFIKDSI